MASVSSISSPHKLLHLPKPIYQSRPNLPIPAKDLSGSSLHFPSSLHRSPRSKIIGGSRRNWRVGAVADDLDVIPVQSSDSTDQQEGGAAVHIVREEEIESVNKVSGFSNEGRFSFESGVAGTDFQGFSSSAAPLGEVENFEKLVDRGINTAIVLAAGTFAITKLLTIDQDYWHGWTLYEILRYAPLHNWAAYEDALKTNPVLAKMMISGVVYALGDWIAQCYEGKPLFEFDRARMFRSGLVGFSFHGSLSHYYYQLCEALFPFDDWWVVPAKVVFDQTIWAAVWNSIYFVLLGFLRFESPVNIFNELKATFWPMLTAGWKLWPFAHLITYGAIPLEQRLLWVDCVELIWVTILSTYSNEKSEARTLEKSVETTAISPLSDPKD